MKLPLLCAVVLILSGCGAAQSATSAGPATAGTRPAPRTYTNGPVRALAGSDAVIGRDAAALTRMFGAPRLTIDLGAGHKLQFASDRCVLDAYLYAPRDGAEPVVTHVDARNADGADVERAACIAALQRR